MKSPLGYVSAILLTAVVAGSGGWFLGRQGLQSDVRAAETERASFESRNRDLRDRIEAMERRESLRRSETADIGAPAPDGDPEPAGDEEAAAAAPDPGPTPAERLRRIDEIRASVAGWFEAGDGEKALAALKELAALAPEGREAAMELAVRINADVNGPSRLKLSQMTFYTNLGDPAVRDLMKWSLENPSTPEFRVLSAYSLPWTQPIETTVAEFSKALEVEGDVSVQRALVWNLSQMRKPEAVRALVALFEDANRDPGVRTQIVTELATTDDPDVLRRIETAAVGDPDPVVKSAAKAALVIRDPPATGYLITGTLPRSQAAAAGLKTGDILVSYGGSSAKTLDELRSAMGGVREGEQEIPVVVVREGREIRLLLRPGQMGIYGRDVKASDQR